MSLRGVLSQLGLYKVTSALLFQLSYQEQVFFVCLFVLPSIVMCAIILSSVMLFASVCSSLVVPVFKMAQA